MGEGAVIALIFAVLVVFAIIFFSVFFPRQVGEKLPLIKKISLRATGLDVEFYEQAVLQKERREISQEEGVRTLGRIKPGRILWVDDNPDNNELETKALEERGVEVDFAKSNDEALKLASTDPTAFDLVLSDVDRGPGKEKAGLELPSKLRDAGVEAPIAFYVGRADHPTTADGDRVFDAPSQLFDYIGEQLDSGDGKAARR